MATNYSTLLKNGSVSGLPNYTDKIPQYRGGSVAPTFRIGGLPAYRGGSSDNILRLPPPINDGKRPVQHSAMKPVAGDNPFSFPTLPQVGNDNPFLSIQDIIPQNQFLGLTPDGLQFGTAAQDSATRDIDIVGDLTETFQEKQVGIITGAVGVALIVLALAQIVKPL